MGDRTEESLLAGSEIEATIDFGVGEPIEFEVSNAGLRKLSDHLTNSYSEMMSDFGVIYLDRMTSDWRTLTHSRLVFNAVSS